MAQSTPQQRDEIVALLEAGYSSDEIAQQVGVSPPTVWGVKAHWTIGKREAEGAAQVAALDIDPADITRALGVLGALAVGVDPLTNEALPDDSILQRPQVIRALFCAVRFLERSQKAADKLVTSKQGQRAERVLPENAGKSWSMEEDSLLCERFDAGTPVKDIAQMHGRTLGSITSRLVKMGKIQSTDVVAFAAESD